MVYPIKLEEVTPVAKKPKNAPAPRITKVKVTGKLDSLTDLLKLRLFEYSPQSVDELVQEAQQHLLTSHNLAKIQKNVNRCLAKNPCFRSEGKGLWCLRLDGLKENDAAHRVLQAHGDALRLSEINEELKEAGKPEVPGEQKLVADGRFLRLKDGRWGLIHWAYVEPEPAAEVAKGVQEAAPAAVGNSPTLGSQHPSPVQAIAPSAAAEKSRPQPVNAAVATGNGRETQPPGSPARTAPGRGGSGPQVVEMPRAGEQILPLAKPAPAAKESDFWDKLFPLKHTGEKTAPPAAPKFTPVKNATVEPPAWEEIAAGAEAAVLTLETEKLTPAPKEFSLINGGKAAVGRQVEQKDEEKEKLRQEIEDLRQENKNLLSDLEKLHRRKEELRQELTQIEEQLVNLRVERDTLKKRVSHLETRLMQLQGTLNKTVSDAQAEQARLKQQLREQEYRLQTTLIANEDLERTVADLQKERQELKRQLAFWPVRLALRLAALFGFGLPRERTRARAYSR
ncbi:Chromosome partition protein Smc [Neomoorella carbonis]